MPLGWQTLPLSIDPVLFFIGPLPVTWYAAAYIFGTLLSTFFFISLARRKGLIPDASVSIEFILTILWGVLIGARLGYIFLYGGSEYFSEPWRIISPYDFSLGEWVGIRGLSFHGGLIGGAIGLWFFTREANRHFLDFSDVVVQAVPIALFFGRVGNFFNQELVGRMTEGTWGMVFPGYGEALRHPSTLYEALGEGVLLFLLLFVVSRFPMPRGLLTGLFLLLYAIIRGIVEGYREPDAGIGLIYGMFTLGQVLSLLMAIIAVFLIVVSFFRRRVV